MIKIDNIYMASQVIIIKGWSLEEADIKQEFAASILNDMIAAKEVDIILEMPQTGLYMYQVLNNDPDHVHSTHALIIEPGQIATTFSMAGRKIQENRSDISLRK